METVTNLMKNLDPDLKRETISSSNDEIEILQSEFGSEENSVSSPTDDVPTDEVPTDEVPTDDVPIEFQPVNMKKKDPFYQGRKSRKELLKFYRMHCSKGELLKVAINVSIEDYVDDTEIAKCVKQIARIYAANRRSIHPCELHIVGIKTNGRMQECLSRQSCEKWRLERHFDDSHKDLFKKDDIVFITRDATEELQKIEKNKVYILDGSMDFVTKTNLGCEYAEKAGWKTVKLPYGDFLEMKRGSVFRIYSIFEIISNVAAGADLRESIFKAFRLKDRIFTNIVDSGNEDDDADESETSSSLQ